MSREVRSVTSVICPNCDTALPGGCGGVFKDSDGDSCWLNRPDKVEAAPPSPARSRAMADALDDFVQAQIDALSCGNWLFNCECGRCADRREMQLEHDSRQIALRELQRLRKLEQRALIWSAYQDDDSKRDQQTDPQLARQANEAELSLFEALI